MNIKLFKHPGSSTKMTSEINDYFPHSEVREGQDKLIEDFLEALKTGKVLLAHAPTGLGKTASTLSVALKEAIEKKKIVFFLTNRHTQHKIAVQTLKEIKKKLSEPFYCADLIGKRWMCNQEISSVFGSEFNDYCKAIVEKGECEFYNKARKKEGLQVEAEAFLSFLKKQGPLHTEELIDFSKEKRMCSYEMAVALAKKAHVIIGDYNYLFNPFVAATLLNKLGKELGDVIVIVDEGHNLPGRVTDMLSNNLTSNMIKNALIEAKKYGYKGAIVWLQEIMQVLTSLGDFAEDDRNKEKLVDKELFLSKMANICDYEQLINEFELAADEIRKKQRRSYLGGIASFLEAWQGEDEGYVRYIIEHRGKYGPVISLNYSCLDPGIVTRDVFSQVHAGVVMSGTLKPTFMYKDLFGIKEVIEKEYLSPFPPENKLTLVIPETTTKFTLRGEAMFRRIAHHCSEVSELVPGNIAIFFPSYFLRDTISPFIESPKKRFWEKSSMTKEEKEELLDEFRKEKDNGGILLGVTGANFAEGVDLPGDLLKGVVVVGLPLAKPNLKTKKTIEYYEQKFGRGWDYGYTYPAFSKCIQSAGRCIRSEKDQGIVVFLDERFAWRSYFNCFPEKVGLIVTKDYGSLVGDFFK